VAVKIYKISTAAYTGSGRGVTNSDDGYYGDDDNCGGEGRGVTNSDDGYYDDDDNCGGEEEDWVIERRNNLHFRHPNIMPILATINYGSYNMTIYPLAQTSLNSLMNTNKTCSISLIEIVNNIVKLFSALSFMHFGIPDCCGYHFDIKPQHILVRMDKSWALTGLRLAHFKPVVVNDPTFSATGRRPCAEEYAGPDGEIVHRSFDIWSMGCVFAELLVWYAEGGSGVKRFRESRRTKKGYKVIYEFHENGRVKEAVLSKFDSLANNHRDPVFAGSISIVRLLLNPDQSERPSSNEAQVLLCALLGDDESVEKLSRDITFKPHVKVITNINFSIAVLIFQALLDEFESANRKKQRSETGYFNGTHLSRCFKCIFTRFSVYRLTLTCCPGLLVSFKSADSGSGITDYFRIEGLSLISEMYFYCKVISIH
jgi:serine/threonine protein kinase